MGHALAAQAPGDVPEGAQPGLQVGQFAVAELAQRAPGRAGLVLGGQGQGADGLEVVLEEQGVGLLVGEAACGCG